MEGRNTTLKNRFLPIKPILGVIGVVAAMALVLGAFAGVAFADQEVHVKHATLDANQGACLDSGGTVNLWHFIINGLTSDAPASIHVIWDNGAAQEDVPLSPPPSDTAHYETTLHQGLLVTDATAMLPDEWTGQFNLSHVGCEQTVTAKSAVSTTVHDAAHSTVDSVSLGTQVHDKVDLTTDPTPVTLPDASSITVNYFDGDCTSPIADTTGPQSVSGQSSPVNLENQLPKTVGVGQHSYQASFTSGDTDVVESSTGPCEPFEVTKGTSKTSTEVHNAGHADITNGQVALGAIVHDTATVSGVDGFPVNQDGTGTVTFSLYNSGDCNANLINTEANVPFGNADQGNGATKSSDTAPLAAGQYGYQATYNGDASYNASLPGACEPFTVTKSDTTTTTQVHDAAHHNITNGGVQMGSYVHDKASVAGNPAVPGFAVDGTVTFSLYSNSGCTGDPINVEPNVTVGSNPTDGTASTPKQITTPGNYGYQATYSGNGNYNGSTVLECEPFSVFQPGKTMGYWGNTNGQKTIDPSGNGSGYAVNSVNIGRGAIIDTKAESLKVLPNTLNACGKGTPQIFTIGGSTSSADCTLASGVNKSSLNTLASQTLALGYNLKPNLRPGFAGQTIGQLQCTAYLTAGLTGSSTVNDAFNAAVALINGSASGGTTTQSQIGAMNSLLGCLNREA
jgi:hypothetical protein